MINPRMESSSYLLDSHTIYIFEVRVHLCINCMYTGTHTPCTRTSNMPGMPANVTDRRHKQLQGVLQAAVSPDRLLFL